MNTPQSTYADADSRWMEVNDVRLWVSDWGGEGDTIVFAHPTGFLGAVWQPTIACLRAGGCTSRIVTFDQRGHGMSSKPDSGYAWLEYAHDLEALMGSLGLEGVLGVGHSAGATTTAVVSVLNPARFRRLVMIDPILFDPEVARVMHGDAPVSPMAARTRTRRLVWPSREELFDSYRLRRPYDTWLEDALRIYVEHGTFDRPDGEIELLCPGRIEAQVYENASDFDGFAYLRRVGVPVLLVRGETTDSFSPEGVRRARAALHEHRFLEVAGSSHFIPMEKPEEIAALIVAEQAA